MPDTEGLTQQYAHLSQAKRLLLEKRLKIKTGASRETLTTIPRLSEREAVPLSLGQQRLWFLDRLDPENPVYNEFVALRLQGQLQIELLERSLNAIARRHEILRTSIRGSVGKPVQIIQPFQPFVLKQVDVRNYETHEREQIVRHLGEQEARTPFVLVQAPLWRVTLLLLDEQTHVLFLTIHHLICDGWSSALFVKELCTHYQNYEKTSASSLLELPIQYADYAAWQQSYLQKEAVEQQLAYWKKQLEGMPTLLELPTDRLRPAVQSFHGFTYPFEFPATLLQKLKALCRREDVTLYMVLLAAFQTLLARYTGQEDIVVGSPIAGRNIKETEDLIGFFVNLLVLRTNFSGNPRFLDLLKQVRTVAVEAYTHQDVPFEMLVDMLQPDRKLSHNPLVQIVFAFYNGARPTLEFTIPQLTVTQMDEIERGTSKFDFSIFMWETKDSVGGLLEWCSEIFTLPTIQRIMGNYQMILEGIVAAPETPVADLPLLNMAEQHEQLVHWNNTFTPFPATFKSITQLVEEQAEQNSSRPAVISSTKKLTYGELNRQANQLAHYLQWLGVEPEQHIAICVERSTDFLVGIVAILKTGAAYLPLDPTYPSERLAFMLQDAGVPVLLAQRRIASQLPDTHQVRVIWLDQEPCVYAQQEESNLIQCTSADNLAYSIYTSGSTGTPKGVQITQQGLLNLIFWHQKQYAVTTEDRATQIASIGFDAAVWEIWPYLSIGACLYLPDPEMHLDLRSLQNWLCACKITHCFLPTPLAESILALSWPHSCSLRALLTGGDRLHRPDQPPPFDLFNHYGPTEYSVVTTSGQVHNDGEDDLPTIGRPISNTFLYILDGHMQPVPVGVSGQLYIGGSGLARGYLKHPALTAERFVPDPFSGKEGARLYQTGDLVSYLPNGDLKFIGRGDHQIKLRGLRIELGEVEAVIRQNTNVREAVVKIHEETKGQKQLIAYVVPNPTCELTIEQMRQDLQKKLPVYMIPSVFMTLVALPLTANGKIDMAALPAPIFAHTSVEEETQREPDQVEQTLLHIWAEVLGKATIKLHDNFFEMGGDSILSIQAVARARDAGIYLTPRLLFQNQTIAELARVVSTTPDQKAEQVTLAGEVPLTPIQHWFFEENFADPHHWNQAFVLEIRWSVQVNLLQAALASVVKQHDAFRLRFTREARGWKQQLIPLQVEPTISFFDLSPLSPYEQGRRLTQEATRLQESLDLQNGPLLCASLFSLDKENFRLLLIIHHLIVDGVSWRILLEDLQKTYQQIEQKKEPRFAPKTTSFLQWSRSLQNYVSSLEIYTTAKLWIARISHANTHIPIDFVSGKNTVASMKSTTVTLSMEETQTFLQVLAHTSHATPFELLITALGQVLKDWTGASSWLIDLEGHGREEILEELDLSGTVGWFTSLYPFSLTYNNADPGKALMTVKEQIRTLPHKGLGYGLLRYLSGDLELMRTFAELPRALMSFNYLGQFDQVFSTGSFWRMAQEYPGPSYSMRGMRHHLLNVEISIIDKKMHIMWLYSENIHRQSTIDYLAQNYVDAIRALIAYQREPMANRYISSDFPDEDLSQEDLTAILQQLAKDREEIE